MGDCSCIYMGDGEPVDNHEWHERTARKGHECSQCGGKIHKGDRYLFDEYTFERKRFRHKTCAVCRNVAAAFFCDGAPFEEMWAMMSEHIVEMEGQIEGECLAGLLPEARNKICDMIEEYWKKNPDQET